MHRIMVMAAAVLCAGLLACAASVHADVQEVPAMLEKLPSSPRLFLLRGEENELRQRIEADPQLKAVWELVLRSADAIVDAPPVERKMEGRRLLSVSRQCLRRMTHLGLAYRLTGERKYAERGKQEMLAVAAFTDWNPSHFLDVAEMTAGMAIGLDWLHDTLDDSTRAAIRDAIVKKGLEPSIKQDHWSRARNNWNQVCNAGMALGALMVAEEHPELANKMLSRAIETVPLSMHEYAPDGAYPEGPMYWEYGTTFNVLLISALEKAMGSDFALLKQLGFDRTADYFVHVKGPTGLWFNYADCSQAGVFSPSPAMHYLAAWQNRPGLLQDQRQMLQRLVKNPDITKPSSTDRLLPMLLIWSRPGTGQDTPAQRHYIGQGMTPVAIFRTSWADDATFAAIKAGQASAPHGHMDVGTFVIDMQGARFAEDLGMQNYHSLESIGVNMWNGAPDGDRWRVFRIGAGAHSILTVNGQNPIVTGRAEIVASTDRSARLDLSKVYEGQLQVASRELTLNPDGSVWVADEVRATPQGGVVRWALVTRATPKLENGDAMLVRDGKQVKLKVRADKPVQVKVLAVAPRPAEYDAANDGVSVIGFEQRLEPDEKANWTIEFSPVR